MCAYINAGIQAQIFDLCIHVRERSRCCLNMIPCLIPISQHVNQPQSCARTDDYITRAFVAYGFAIKEPVLSQQY